MNAKEARRIIGGFNVDELRQEDKDAIRIAFTALRHEEVMERIADLEAQKEAKLTLEDLLHIKVQTETLERLLHHLPDHIVDHIGFICECEMKERYEARENERPVEDIDWEQLEMIGRACEEAELIRLFCKKQKERDALTILIGIGRDRQKAILEAKTKLNSVYGLSPLEAGKEENEEQ